MSVLLSLCTIFGFQCSFPSSSSCANAGSVSFAKYSSSEITKTIRGSAAAAAPCERSAACPSALPRTWSLLIVGAQYSSTWWMTNSVPFSCGTKRMRGLYIVSVRSRTRATCLPRRVSWRMPKGRPRMHMLAWTPATITFSIPRAWSRL